MSYEDAKQAYWRRIRSLTLGMTLAIAGFTMLLPAFMPALNGYRFMRFPLGYFLAGNASIFALAILLYAFFAGQQRSDRAYNVTLQF
ncbi:MAG: sodium/substrate symporter small subunit [Rhodomicrobium sp.]